MLTRIRRGEYIYSWWSCRTSYSKILMVKIVQILTQMLNSIRHEICQKIYTAGYSGKNITPLFSPNFNSFGNKNIKKLVKMETFTPLARILHCRRLWRQWQISPLNSIICDTSHNALINLRAALAGRSGGKQSNGQALSISCSKVMVMRMSLPPQSLLASISLSLITVRSALHGKQVDRFSASLRKQVGRGNWLGSR